MYAPKLDTLLRVFGNRNLNPEGVGINTKEKINKLYELLDKIKPLNEEEYKVLYFSVPRGPIEEYADYEDMKEEKIVNNYKEFEKYFEEEYPDEIYWYRLATNKDDTYRIASINNRMIIYHNLAETFPYDNEAFNELIDFLIVKVEEIIKMLEDNIYNDYITNNLSYKNKFGVIKRSDYWNFYPKVKENLLEYISEKEIEEFVNTVTDDTDDRLNEMTANKYFECVRLVYQSNGYNIDNMTDKEIYLKYADGRDGGLCDIELDSPEEFASWLNKKQWYGAHPWEIIRGHSFARVNMQVVKDDKGYYLSIPGEVILRQIEIAKIYLALKKNNIPVKIYHSNVIKNAFIGSDYLGIVPSYIMPIRCESYFKEYEPHDFIHIEDEKILDKIIWQDIEKLCLKAIE